MSNVINMIYAIAFIAFISSASLFINIIYNRKYKVFQKKEIVSEETISKRGIIVYTYNIV